MTARTPDSRGRIVLFGATGHAGRLILEALRAAGETPVLAGRDRTVLGLLTGADHMVIADLADPASLRGILRPGDVVVSAAGPFIRFGGALLDAVIEAGAIYIDASGEAAFVRQVYEEYGPRAAAAGATLITSCGYGFLAGSLAGALALDQAAGTLSLETTGPQAVLGLGAVAPVLDAARIEVAYFVGGGSIWTSASAGTLRSIAGMFGLPSYTYRKEIVPEPRPMVRDFVIGDRLRPAATVAGAEHFTLPRLHPDLQSVDVYIGMLGAGTRVLARIPPAVHRTLGRAVLRLMARAARRRPRRATLTARVAAIAYDAAGLPLAEVHMSGCDPYEFTAGMVAWCARKAKELRTLPPGAIGPVEAFGLSELQTGCAEAGIVRLSG
jgi:hypothetical protein